MINRSAFENIQFVKDWFKTRQTSKINFEQIEHPSHDPNYELKIVCEMRFQPQSPDEMQAEIWFAEDGAVGFGLERQQRIAKLLGISSRSKRFAGGKEPSSMSIEALGTLLDLIANGQLAISVICLPFLGLMSTKLLVSMSDRLRLQASGFKDVDSIFSVRVNPLGKVLTYSRWT